MAIDLRKQTEAASASEPSNPSNNNNSVGRAGIGIDINANQDLGTWGGVNVEAEAKVSLDIEAEIRSQGLTFNTDPNTGSMSLGAGLGSAKGKLGGNIGVELGTDSEGNVEITGARGAVSIAGFGGNIEVNRDGSGSLGVEIGGFSIEVSRDEEGKPSLTLGWGIGPGEVSVTFSPDGEGSANTSEEAPSEWYEEPKNFTYPPNWGKENPSPDPPLIPNPPIAPFPVGDSNKLCKMVVGVSYGRDHFFGNPVDSTYYYARGFYSGQGAKIYPSGVFSYNDAGDLSGSASCSWHEWEWYKYIGVGIAPTDIMAGEKEIRENPPAIEINNLTTPPPAHWNEDWARAYKFISRVLFSCRSMPIFTEFWGIESEIYKYLNSQTIEKPPVPKTYNGGWHGWYLWILMPAPNYRFYKITARYCGGDKKPTKSPLGLPNYPQHPKRMDCCDKIEEIYKYLGIAKLKKHKFKIAKQFLAPGSKGTEDAEDYYQITQALFRMLANGLILNPKSQPLGSKWQNVNATAWASQMYEMMAESMSDGNSTQRVEISTIMQLVQMMSLLAETSRKVELIIDALDIEPNLVSEELPVCFTIHESHKGFGKKEPKKIDTTKLKTDNDVEAVLGKILVPSKIPIVKWQFKPGSISIVEALKNNGN